MRRLLLVVVLFTALAAVPAVQAQIRGVPPSVTSMGQRGFSRGPAPSITSLGPHGFGFRGVPHRGFGGHGFGGQGFGGHFGPKSHFGVHFGFGGHKRFGFRFGFGHRRGFGYAAAPVYVPYYYPYPVYAEPVPVDPYYDPSYYDDRDDDGVAPTVFDRRGRYEPRDGYRDERYGDHYFDEREEARRELEERDARVRERRDARQEEETRRAEDERQRAQEQELPSTVLVFRNGARREIRNYAIVGDTLWVLTATRAHKVLLSQLDLRATMRENDERGVGFRLPRSADNGPAPLPELRP